MLTRIEMLIVRVLCLAMGLDGLAVAINRIAERIYAKLPPTNLSVDSVFIAGGVFLGLAIFLPMPKE